MRTDDNTLLELLGAALRPAIAPEPTLAELTALEEAVRFPAVGPRRPVTVNRRALAALFGVGVLATSGTAFAFERAGVPDPVRAAAHAVGLPIDSPAEHDAQEATDRLREALAASDNERVRAAAAELQQHLGHLPAATRHKVAEPLLADARQRLDHANRPAAADDESRAASIEDAVNEGTIPARNDRGEPSEGRDDNRRPPQSESSGSSHAGGKSSTVTTPGRSGASSGAGGRGGVPGITPSITTITEVRPGIGGGDDNHLHEGVPGVPPSPASNHG